jgi:hypothetical protein
MSVCLPGGVGPGPCACVNKEGSDQCRPLRRGAARAKCGQCAILALFCRVLFAQIECVQQTRTLSVVVDRVVRHPPSGPAKSCMSDLRTPPPTTHKSDHQAMVEGIHAPAYNSAVGSKDKGGLLQSDSNAVAVHVREPPCSLLL